LILCNDDIVFEESVKCNNIICKGSRKSFKVKGNIIARSIDAWNINAWNIDVLNINARDINIRNIDAGKIYAWNVVALDINAHNIDARNIDAENINAWDIKYFAVCFARRTFKCVSIKGGRNNCRHFCLDSEIEYKKKENNF
jgi:hypothetical protein